MKNLLRVKFALSIILLSQLVRAQETTAVTPQPKDESRKTTLTLLLDTSATLARQAANSAGEEMSYSGFYRVDLGVPLSRALTANLRTGYSQEYSYALPDNSSGALTDSRLGLAYGLGEIRKDLSLTLSSSLTLPTSKESGRAGLKSAVNVGAMATQKIGKFTFQLAPAWTEFFHDVITQMDGKQNLSRSMSLLALVGYDIIPELNINVSLQPIHSWTYYGTPRDSYFLAYDLTYTANSHAAFSVGIYNKASALKSNGLDYNYAIYDQSQFMGYFDVTLTL